MFAGVLFRFTREFDSHNHFNELAPLVTEFIIDFENESFYIATEQADLTYSYNNPDVSTSIMVCDKRIPREFATVYGHIFYNMIARFYEYSV